MDLPATTRHQRHYELPDMTQGTVSATAARRDDVTLDFTSHAGNHLILHVPRSLFDALYAQLGNAYKAGCWVATRWQRGGHPSPAVHWTLCEHDNA